MPESWFMKGLLVALIFGVPAGAIGALTLQRTLRGGFFAGFVTGMGSTAADVLYACIGVFGITLVSDLLLRYQNAIRIVGGAFIVFLGIRIFARPGAVAASSEIKIRPSACFLTSFAVAIANPATILSFITAFAALGISEKPGALEGTQLVLGVAIGTALWWAALAGIACIFRSRINERAMKVLNCVLGTLLIAFGVYAAIRAFV